MGDGEARRTLAVIPQINLLARSQPPVRESRKCFPLGPGKEPVFHPQHGHFTKMAFRRGAGFFKVKAHSTLEMNFHLLGLL